MDETVPGMEKLGLRYVLWFWRPSYYHYRFFFLSWARRLILSLLTDGIEVDIYCFFLSEEQLQRLQLLCSEAGFKISAL